MKPTVSFSIDANLLGGVWHPSADRRAFWVNDEVLDLEEAVRAEIPVSDLLCVEAVSCGPVRRPAYSAAASTSGGHDIIDSQIDLRQRISK
jgi:hypothetical protein